MSRKTWMPLYVADYLGDTSRLTCEQHGAYLLLIMDYWRNGAPPDDDQVLASITKLSVFSWKKQKSVIEKFFTIEGGFWKHKRIEKEIRESEEASERYKDRAKKAAAKRWENENNSNAASNATSIPEAMLDICPPPSPSPFFQNKEDNSLRSLSKKKEFSSDGCENSEAEENPPQPEPDHQAPLLSAKSIPVEQLYVALDQRKAKPPPQPKQPRKKPLTPMPEGFEPNADHIDRFRKIGIVQAEKINREFEKFTDHHKKMGSQFADWDAALRTWIGNIEEFQAASDKRGSGWINQNSRDQSPSELAAAAAELLKRKASGGLQPDWLGTTIDI